MVRKQLRKLHVTIGGDWESSTTNETNLNEFIDLLKQGDNMPNLKGPDLAETLSYAGDTYHQVERRGIQE
jgi:hypothetical protein